MWEFTCSASEMLSAIQARRSAWTHATNYSFHVARSAADGATILTAPYSTSFLQERAVTEQMKIAQTDDVSPAETSALLSASCRATGLLQRCPA